MITLPVEEAYRLWSDTYDGDPNPLLALERRVLSRRLALAPGMRVLDLATGTGRWLEYVLSQGAEGFGVDVSPEMLARAARKAGLRGRLIRANVSQLSFPRNFAELAICSFALGYVQCVDAAFREMARTARRVIVSDLHPEAARHGWARSFRAGGEKYQVAHYNHSRFLIDDSARAAGLRPMWTVEACFEEHERGVFEQGGKAGAFEAVRLVPAILIECWERR